MCVCGGNEERKAQGKCSSCLKIINSRMRNLINWFYKNFMHKQLLMSMCIKERMKIF